MKKNLKLNLWNISTLFLALLMTIGGYFIKEKIAHDFFIYVGIGIVLGCLYLELKDKKD